MDLKPFVPGPPLRDGRIPMGLRPMKRHVRAYLLNHKPVTVTLPGINTSDEVEFQVDLEGHFEWTRLVGNFFDYPGTFSEVVAELLDPQKNRRLQNRPVHIATVAAIIERAFRLPEPYFFNVGDGRRSMNLTLRKLDAGSSGELAFAMYGRRYYHSEATPDVAMAMREAFGGKERAHAYFLTYKEVAGDGLPPTIAAGGTATYTFEADSDAESDLMKLMVPSGQGAFSFVLRERDTNRQLSNGAVHSQNGFGNAEFPFHFADTYLLGRSKALLFEVTNLSGADLRLYATIAGRRLITEG